MAPRASTTHVQESLLTLEMRRIHDVFHDEMVDETQRREAVATAAEWLVGMWRDDRLFLQTTALPLLSFFMFEVESASHEDAKSVLRDPEASRAVGGLARSPWAIVLRHVVDSTAHGGCVELFVRLIAIEFFAFVTTLSTNKASSNALSSVFRCFMGVTGRHDLCVETLVEAVAHRIVATDLKRRLLSVVDEAVTLTPSQKACFFVEFCRLEAITSVREHGARLLQGLVNYVSSPLDLIPLLMDSSRKIRKIAVRCIIDVGAERLLEEVDEDMVAETIVDMATIVSGAIEEKRFGSFVRSFFATASTFDEVCRLSLLLDEVSKSSTSAEPHIRELLMRAASSVLEPSMLHNYQPKRYPESL